MTDHAAHSTPGELHLIEALLNSLDLEHPNSADELADPATAGAWLAERGLAPAGTELSAAERDRVITVREGLRAVLLGHNGGEVDPGRLAGLRAEARRAALTVDFTPDPALVPAGTGADAVIARVMAIVARAQADGTWTRLKACGDHTCQWAFYDHSRNRSRTWCSMAVCGNRAKARAYRERRGG